MKQRFFVFLFLATFACPDVFAQDTNTTATPQASGSGHLNILKINVLALGLGNFSLQDEFTLSGHTSVALGFSMLPNRYLPAALVKEDSSNNIKNIQFSGMSVTPEFRYYFTGKAPKGFYAAPYIRYSKYKADSYTYTYDDNGVDNTMLMDGEYKVFGLGLMLGAQWKLGKHIALDWWILGATMGTNEVSMHSSGTFSPSQQQSIKDDINSIDLPVGSIESTVTSTSVDVKVDVGVPAARAFGLALGYIF
jgi:hypothetical protein